jgi:hypothetical protein
MSAIDKVINLQPSDPMHSRFQIKCSFAWGLYSFPASGPFFLFDFFCHLSSSVRRCGGCLSGLSPNKPSLSGKPEINYVSSSTFSFSIFFPILWCSSASSTRGTSQFGQEKNTNVKYIISCKIYLLLETQSCWI